MADAGLAALLVRTVVSLAVVLAIVGIAYVVAKRRNGGRATAASTRTARRANGARMGRTGRRRSAPAGVEVVGRVGLNRSTAAVAIRFGDRILLVASSEQGDTNTLAEMSAEAWEELHTVREPLDEIAIAPEQHAVVSRPSFVEALRQATARHG